jgi:cytoskeletal protein CcmA (bactofilin family)
MFRRRAEKQDKSGRPTKAAAPEARGGGSRPAAPASASSGKVEPFTYIQRGTTITGQLEARGRVRVHGVVRGDVKVDGALEVAESGLVEGASVEADDVKIIGRVVVERLLARGKVEIWDGGELIGDVRAASLDIEEGARFTGRSEMAGPGSKQESEGLAKAEANAEDAPAAVARRERPDPADAAADTLLEPDQLTGPAEQP